jgi:predicted TIM-barrel fold metal-dependent hydrolase
MRIKFKQKEVFYMIVDCHNHPDWHGHNLNSFLANMSKNNIDVTWLLSWETPLDEYNPSNISAIPDAGPNGPIPFARCLSYAERAPGKFILGYAPDPRKPDAIDRMKAAISIYGVRIYGELKLRMMYDNIDAISMYRFCGEKGVPVQVHIDYDIDTGSKYPRSSWWFGGGIEAFERAIKVCPETTFIGHAPGFWTHISKDDQYKSLSYPIGEIVPGGKLITMLHTYPNLYCDMSAGSGISAFKRDTKFAKAFLIEFQDRILYARDYFDNVHQDFLNGLELPESVLRKIYSGNALKLIPIQK